jgi:hypothetical protein
MTAPYGINRKCGGCPDFKRCFGTWGYCGLPCADRKGVNSETLCLHDLPPVREREGNLARQFLIPSIQTA